MLFCRLLEAFFLLLQNVSMANNTLDVEFLQSISMCSSTGQFLVNDICFFLLHQQASHVKCILQACGSKQNEQKEEQHSGREKEICGEVSVILAQMVSFMVQVGCFQAQLHFPRCQSQHEEGTHQWTQQKAKADRILFCMLQHFLQHLEVVPLPGFWMSRIKNFSKVLLKF